MVRFHSQTATLIIAQWRAQRYTDAYPLDLIIQQYLRWHMISEPCSNTTEGNWPVAMVQLGISKKMQDAVMDPEFDLIRTTHPLRHWLEEFIISNSLSLSHLEDRIRAAIAPHKTTPPPLRGGASGSHRADYDIRPNGYTTLYRAMTAGRLQGVFLGDDKVDLRKTMPSAQCANDFGNDFAGILYYWTTSTWVAHVYASYCKRAVRNEFDVCVFKMVAGPLDIRVENATWELEYGDTWRKLVWHSRNRKDYPADMEKKHSKTLVFIGPISGDSTRELEKLKSWEQVTEANVLKENGDGDMAVQYVWKGNTAMSAMNDKSQVDLCRWPSKRLLKDPKMWVEGR